MQPSACVASAYVAAAGERACSSGARLPAPGVGQCGSSSVQNGRRAAAPHRWSARLHACPASNESARHVVIRLCFEGRGRGGRIAYARCNAARGRNVTAPCTLNMLAAAACARAPQRSRGEAASAPILGTPPSRYGHDLGGMDTARHSTSFRAARAS